MPVSQAGQERIDGEVRLLLAITTNPSIHPSTMSSRVQLFFSPVPFCSRVWGAWAGKLKTYRPTDPFALVCGWGGVSVLLV
jgi:hypothetical protein